MPRQAFADANVVDRLLDAFLDRLARSPDADGFALRGGMLVRYWVPDIRRPVGDVDLVCHFPFEVRAMHARLREILARHIGDGVVFDSECFRLDTVWPDSPHPGLRLFAAGAWGGCWAEFSVDLTFNVDVWPKARRGAVSRGEHTAALWMCEPEMVVGTKLRVIGELGRKHWRPKDLSDILQMLRRDDRLVSLATLGEAVERSFAQGLQSGPVEVRDVLDRSDWWTGPHSAARWSRFRRQHPRLGPSADLGAAIEELRARLAPLRRST